MLTTLLSLLNHIPKKLIINYERTKLFKSQKICCNVSRCNVSNDNFNDSIFGILHNQCSQSGSINETLAVLPDNIFSFTFCSLFFKKFFSESSGQSNKSRGKFQTFHSYRKASSCFKRWDTLEILVYDFYQFSLIIIHF